MSAKMTAGVMGIQEEVAEIVPEVLGRRGRNEEDVVKIALLEMGLVDDLCRLSNEDTTSIFLAACYAFIKGNK